MTIVAMFSFVLISGVGSRGDFADWLMQLFGREGGSGPVVGEVYGKKVTYKELQDLAQQRQIASSYMYAATNIALSKKMEEIRPSGNQPDFREFMMRLQTDPEARQLSMRAERQRLGEPYFGGSFDFEGLFDYKIWLHQADLLGIPPFGKADINQQLRRLTFTTDSSKKFDDKDSGKIEQALRQRFRGLVSSDTLIAALGNEFRVQMAQEAMFGAPSRMAAPITPEEFWVFFKDNQTKIDVRLLPIKVEEFLDKVTEKPTEKELKDLYEKYKNEEYRPEAKEPGFKQPRRVQIEWISGRSDTDFYKHAAANYQPLVQAVDFVSNGFGNAAAYAQLAPLLLPDYVLPAGQDGLGKDTTLIREYDRLKWPDFLAASYTRRWYLTRPYRIHERNVRKPLNAAAAIGLAFNADPLTPYTTFLGNATLREMEVAARRGTDWVTSAFQVNPVMALAIGSYLTPREEYVPLAEVRDQVEQPLQKALAQNLLVTNLKAIQKEVESKGKAADKKELRDYLAKVIKEYNLQTGGTAELRDKSKNKIADDPGLKPLREAFLHPAPFGDPQGKTFPNLFFSDVKPYVAERFPRSQFGGDGELEWRSGPESFLFWKTDDQPPRTLPLSEPEVKKEVERAWRLQKARELAKKEADRLATDATKETRGDDRALRDFAMKHLQKEPITLPTLSKFMRPRIAREGPRDYEPPRISEDKVPYAGQDFPTKVLALKDKSKGDALVQPDQPETTYYVAVLVDKSEPSMDDFLSTYRSCSSESVHRDPLLQIFEQERQVKYYKDVVAQLQKDAKLQIDKEKLAQFKGSVTEE
jgi:hypothetical protein